MKVLLVALFAIALTASGATYAAASHGSKNVVLTSTGLSGPKVTRGGTYLVSVQADLWNKGSASIAGQCQVRALRKLSGHQPQFSGSYTIPAAPVSGSTAIFGESFTGVLVIPAHDHAVISCDAFEGSVNVSTVRWWVKPL